MWENFYWSPTRRSLVGDQKSFPWVSKIFPSCPLTGVRSFISHTVKNRKCAVSIVRNECPWNSISGVMISVLASSVIGRDICCFTAKHATLMSKSKNWLARIRIMELNEVTCLPTYCCSSDQAPYKCN